MSEALPRPSRAHDAREELLLSQFPALSDQDALTFVCGFLGLLFSTLRRDFPEVDRKHHDELVAEVIRRVLSTRKGFVPGLMRQWRCHLQSVLRRVVAGLPAKVAS